MRSRPALRAIAIVTLLPFTAAAVGCVAHRWRAVPLTNMSLEKEKIQERKVRFTTDTGPVTLRVTRVAFPYVEGAPELGTGLVAFDLRSALKAEILELGADGRQLSSSGVPISEDAAFGASLAGKTVRFETEKGPLVLVVERVEYPMLEGRPRPSKAVVRVDLRRVQAMQIEEVSGVKTALATIGVIAGVWAAILIIVLLTKESCPFVYVDRGEGFELVGEAYAGAAFRSTQRDDLLPLPSLPGGTVRVRLRNEARETQYTDRVELAFVDHAPGLRALSTFDGRAILVGEAVPPAAARDLHGADVTARVATRDQRLWETDLGVAAAAARPRLSEGLEAVFPAEAPRGTRVLEIVGGNTPWLDLVFGRFFAAMGGRLDKYVAAGNDPAAGPRIRRWREREGVDLTVEVLQRGSWLRVATVPTVGPATLRHIAVPLPSSIDAAQDGEHELRVRLRSGLGFWRVDHLALSTEEERSVALQRLPPVSAQDREGRDERPAVETVDGRYDVLEEMYESLDLAFELPPLEPGQARSAFLLSTGYYNVHPPVQGQWSPGTLRAVRDEEGALSRLSLDLAREYLRLARSAPAPRAAGGGR
jgi:hypothetical protein